MDREFNKQDFDNNFRITTIIFSALAVGQIFLLIVFFLIAEQTPARDESTVDNLLIFVIPVIGLTAMIISKFIYNHSLMQVKPGDTVTEKLKKYRTSKIITWAILEGAALISLLAFFLTAEYLYIVVFIFVFGFFLFNRPSKEGFVTDMQVTGPVKESILR